MGYGHTIHNNINAILAPVLLPKYRIVKLGDFGRKGDIISEQLQLLFSELQVYGLVWELL